MIEIKLVGVGCSKSWKMEDRLIQLSRELGIPVQINKVMDLDSIISLGLKTIPVLVYGDEVWDFKEIMMEAIIELSGGKYLFKQLSPFNKRQVYDLYCQCDDYFYLAEGKPADGSNVKELFEELPPGKQIHDKEIYGLFHQGEMLGVVDLVKDFPEKDEWIIGLLLLDPSVRNKGLGSAMHKVILEDALERGAKKLRVGVLEQNNQGFNYWEKLGYNEISRKEKRRFGDKESVVIVMNYLF